MYRFITCCIWHCCLARTCGWRYSDGYICPSISNRITNRRFAYIFSHYTKLGSAIGIVTTLAISLLVFWRKRYYAAMIVYPMGILITHLVNKGIKEIVKRERPSLNEALDALGYSFLVGMQCYLL